MGRTAVAIELTAAEQTELEALAGRRRTAQGLAKRARIVLAAAEGSDNKAIARSLGADENTVGKWRRRFAEHRLDGLYDEPRSGAPRRIEDDEIAEIVRLTLETTPPDATHWSLRSMARRASTSRSCATARRDACGDFHTVLGPGVAHHGDHFHLDLANRRSGKAYCT